MTQPLMRAVQIPAGSATIHADLTIPDNALGAVLFAHGSGSGRHSPRNRFVARFLGKLYLATLLLDLLTEDEETADATTGHLRFNIDFLAERLVFATDWLLRQTGTSALPMGYFGASTGAAAALVAAAERLKEVAAIVSRGGRPDLAGPALIRVEAPTLFIVGGNDTPVIDLNQQALGQLGAAQKEIVIVPGATHLFEEPGALQEVARLAGDWFFQHLNSHAQQTKDSLRAPPR
jgi:pimeloyl-ACP methyl ester carboxylesterase